jgi:hypothetical protein
MRVNANARVRRNNEAGFIVGENADCALVKRKKKVAKCFSAQWWRRVFSKFNLENVSIFV